MTMKKCPKPFLLKPAGKDYLWGGSRLEREYGKHLGMTPLAETWECSTHPDGTSTVASGSDAGRSLKQVLEDHPEYIGTHPDAGEGLPILVKLIDAKTDLSVQVHPDDAYAKAVEGGQNGKSEMWYVVDAEPGAYLVYGFSRDITREQLRASLDCGDVEKYLQKVPVHPDDVFFIPSGMVHAIGAGVMVAEVQENSNLTYRLYDYNRRDKEGNLRGLHIDKALDVANLHGSASPRQPLRVLKYKQGVASEFLCRCAYFQVERLLLNTEVSREMVPFQAEPNSFKVFLCLDGCGSIFMEDGEVLPFFKGDCVFVPAGSAPVRFHGKARFLEVGC